MKKFVYNLMFIAVAILSVAGFSSCNAEDDGYDYSKNSDNNPAAKTVKLYSACISEDYLNLYDLSITLYSGDNTKTVQLTESNGIKKPANGVQIYCYSFDNVDGHYNIDKVEAKITPKANIENMLNTMNPDQTLNFVATSKLNETDFKANGQYDIVNMYGTLNNTARKVSFMTVKSAGGKIFYDFYAESTGRILSK